MLEPFIHEKVILLWKKQKNAVNVFTHSKAGTQVSLGEQGNLSENPPMFTETSEFSQTHLTLFFCLNPGQAKLLQTWTVIQTPINWTDTQLITFAFSLANSLA